MLFLVIPLILFAVFIIVTYSVAKSRQQAPVAEQQNQNNKAETNGQPARPAAPVRPSVRLDPSPYQAAYTTPKAKTATTVQKKSETKPETVKKETHTDTDDSPIVFSGRDAVKGIIYAEVLGKPKALR